MRARTILATAVSGLLAVGLIACGGGTRRTMRLTYVKKDSSESRMLEDESSLKRVKGVAQVIAQIDAQNTVTLQLFVNEDNSEGGRAKVLELGYSQVRN